MTTNVAVNAVGTHPRATWPSDAPRCLRELIERGSPSYVSRRVQNGELLGIWERFALDVGVLIEGVKPIPGFGFDAVRARQILVWMGDGSTLNIRSLSREEHDAACERLLDAWHAALEARQAADPIVVTFPEDLGSLPQAEFDRLRETLATSVLRANELRDDAHMMLERVQRSAEARAGEIQRLEAELAMAKAAQEQAQSRVPMLTTAAADALVRSSSLQETTQRFEREVSRRELKAKAHQELLELDRQKRVIEAEIKRRNAQLAETEAKIAATKAEFDQLNKSGT